jgi:hypothetical protein
MTALLIASLIAGWGLAQLLTGGRYCCPTCGSTRPDGHERDCPWSPL